MLFRSPGEIHGTHFLEAESTPGHMVPSVATEKIPSDTTGNRSRDRPASKSVRYFCQILMKSDFFFDRLFFFPEILRYQI